MDKIDLLILSVVVSVMAFCFSLATKWSYFCAGICAAFFLTVIIGRIAHLASHKQQEGQWEKFVDSLTATHSSEKQVSEIVM